MYESHFFLSHRPFRAAPEADVYIPTGSLEKARQSLVRCLDRAEGPALVVGPSGIGKSLLCQILARHFQLRFQVALLSSARMCTRRALLQSILFELKLPYRGLDESELRLSLIDHLEPRPGGPEGLILLVDEAHTLPLRLLEEIRLLTNLVRGGQSSVRLLLAGGMALEERLANPKLESFQQRIAARCYLQPFARDETIYYVQEQIRRAGGRADRVFTGEAQAAIHTATDGIPRLINQVCDHALMLAALGGVTQIEASGIEEAWADLQQLPVPLNEPPAIVASGSGSAGIVEFGQLDERPPAVAVRSSVGDAAVAKLDEISHRIDSLRGNEPALGIVAGTADDDFAPAAASGTEVEIIFHGAHDPFGGHWDQEEVVIDRYASLDNTALGNIYSVTSDEGRALGDSLKAAVSEPVQSPPKTAASKNAPAKSTDDRAPLSIAATADFSPASDPLLPEEPPLGAERPRINPLGDSGTDDRDLIVVDDDAGSSTPPPTRPRRAEYRQLFSKLRNKA
jgi:type II secretory pathway predicted ATPase ExeA